MVRAAGGGPRGEISPDDQYRCGPNCQPKLRPICPQVSFIFNAEDIHVGGPEAPTLGFGQGTFWGLVFQNSRNRRPILGAQRGARREELALQEYRSARTPDTPRFARFAADLRRRELPVLPYLPVRISRMTLVASNSLKLRPFLKLYLPGNVVSGLAPHDGP